MQLFVLNLAAHCARQLGMAPGGEMRRAYKEVQSMEGPCDLVLGDRPIDITMKRVFGLLSMWEKIRFLYQLSRELNEEIT